MFEYHFIKLKEINLDNLKTELNYLGEQGWEVVGEITTYDTYFDHDCELVQYSESGILLKKQIN